jgi:Na+/H+ antiporter NhaD/arsenite permease-like protein
MISSIPNLIVAAELKIGFIEFFTITAPLTLILSLVSMLVISHQMKKNMAQSTKCRLKWTRGQQ